VAAHPVRSGWRLVDLVFDLLEQVGQVASALAGLMEPD
jgi:hypothetical protein